MPARADDVGGPGGREPVQRLADRPVPDGVHMHPETRRVQPGHLLRQVGGIHVGQTAVPGLAAAGVQVRVDHAGGEVLRDPILHDLDHACAEPARLAGLPPVEQVIELLSAPGPVPPEGPGHPGGEGSVRRGGQVGRHRVRVAEVLPHDGVLPGGDAQRVQVLLGQQQPADLLGEAGAGHQTAHEQRRPLVQGALRLTVTASLDPPVPGVRRGRGQAGQVQRPGVDPGAVPVPVREVGRPVRDHAVQQLAGRGAAGEPLHPPAAAVDPLPVRLGRGVGPDPVQRPGLVLGAVQVAAQHRDPRERRVNVRVLEPGQQGPALRGTASVWLPARSRISSSVPTAMIRPPCTATAVAGGPSTVPMPAPRLVSSLLAASPPAVAGTIRRPSGSTV